MVKTCIVCGKKFSNRTTDYCSSECAIWKSLSPEEQFKEEKDKLLDEIKEKVERRMRLFNPDEKYDTDNELLK